MWPQLTFVILSAFGAAVSLARSKNGLDFLTSSIAAAITHGLLWAGGFYDVFSR